MNTKINCAIMDVLGPGRGCITTWKERSHQRIPRKEEVENLWVSLCPTVPNP